jgi:uncharacterized protein (UPF0332 family)
MPNIFSEKSTQTWDEGRDCLNRGFVNTAANRIYYSVFQAIKGFAIQRGMMTMETSDSVHRQTMEIVGQHGGRGTFFRRRLNELLALRLTADYKAESVDRTDLEDLINDADCIRKHYIRLAGTEP